MRWIELHNMEYGECIVLGAAREILMVDCGSSNLVIRESGTDCSDYVENGIMRRYRCMDVRAFLLTHCHHDHISGLWRILKKSPGYFHHIFLPVSPLDERGKPLILEFALFVYVFLNRLTGYSKVNVSALELFIRTVKAAGTQNVTAIRQGDSFIFDGVTYDILWPRETGFPFPSLFASAVEEMNICLSSPYLPAFVSEFLRLKDQFCSAYTDCCRVSPVSAEGVAETSALLDRISGLIPQLLLLPCAHDIAEILNSSVTQNAYSEALNAASVIFQNRRSREASCDDILMTGDAPPESLEAVADRLYDSYYIIKAPHHGMKGSFSSLLADIGASHILISNGEYRKGGGIDPAYAELDAVKHCTNNSVCPWYRQNGSCCNRLVCCYDHSGSPGLTIKCPVYRLGSKNAPCGIYVVSSGGRRACLCDERSNKNMLENNSIFI